MTGTEIRKFTILDMMVLVAVVAISIAWLRFMSFFQDSSPFPWRGRGIVSVQIGLVWVTLITMLALIPLRLRYPRPSVTRLWRQPGWLACNAVALTFAMCLIQHIPYAIGIMRHYSWPRQSKIVSLLDQLINGFLFNMTTGLGNQAGITIVASWATLALVGAWESDKVWIDRAGSVCGVCFVLYPILWVIVGVFI